MPSPIVIDAQEMYGEFFDIPAPDELVFVSSFTGGEVFRSGCTFRRGHGKVFYFSPGDQEYPVYHHPDVRRVIANGVAWARARRAREPPRRGSAALVRGGYLTVSAFRTIAAAGPVRLALVGAGAMGRAWLRSVTASPEVALACVVDVVRRGAAGARRPRHRGRARLRDPRRGGLPPCRCAPSST